MLLKIKTKTIPEINNTKQAKTTCLISRTFCHDHQVDSTPRRHFFCQMTLHTTHYPVHSSGWIPFPWIFGDFHYKLREPVVKRYGIHILYFATNRSNLVQFIIFEKTTGILNPGTFISLCCCHSRNSFKAHLFLYFVEDGTASSARTCSSDALFGKRKRLGLPFFFSAITIKCNKTLLTWDKRLSKYRQRLAWAIYHSRREYVIFACLIALYF